MEDKRAHLGILQTVVNRMSANSFQLRGWSVTLVSALFALAATGSQPRFVYLAYFPAISFWVLDGYYFHQERLFRKLYDHVRVLDEPDIDFSMSTEAVRAEVDGWSSAVFSKTLEIPGGSGSPAPAGVPAATTARRSPIFRRWTHRGSELGRISCWFGA